MNSRIRVIVCAAALLGVLAGSAEAQVGKSLGVVDANTAAEKDLLAMPHMTPAIVKGLIDKRPFASITELNAYPARPEADAGSRRTSSTARRSSTST